MALSRAAKEDAIAELTELLQQAKIMVFANYQGLSVKELQQLRADARDNGVTVKVAKNRLVRRAIMGVDALKESDTDAFTGQMLYAFSSEDEVAPAQTLAKFAKDHPSLELVGAIDEEAKSFNTDQVKQLSQLPSKDQLRGQLVGVMAAPVTGFVSVLAGNIRGLVNVLNARKEELN